jgi:LacI family transcriptional regulator
MSSSAQTKATILDVAKLAQVSKKTVSRVLNKEPNVRQETVSKVEQAMAALDYRPSLSARSLASNRSYLIALLYDNPVAHYIVDVQSGVLDYCKSQGYSLIIQPCRHLDNESTQVIEELVHQSNIDGFILTPPFSDMDTVTSFLETLSKPYVRIAPVDHETGSDCVYCDDYQSAYEMTSHLISLQHRHIGFIIGHPDHRACQLRFQGYKQALKDNRIAFEEAMIAQGDNSFESGLRCAEQLLSRKRPPTAIFASNDEMAAGVMAIAHQRGWKIPTDLSIAGFDDNPIAAQIWPQLTTVRQPVTDMARDAAKMLIHNLGGRGQTESNHTEHLLPCELVYRQSTGVCPAS